MNDECIKPNTYECIKIINGDSQCRNINNECHTIDGQDKICRTDQYECYTILSTDQICSDEIGQSTF